MIDVDGAASYHEVESTADRTSFARETASKEIGRVGSLEGQRL